MVDAMRAMLDELMGKERDLPPEERTGRGISYKDREICKYALAGLCPYGLFKNTKSDLGQCKYEVHEDDVEFGSAKEEWDKLQDADKERYGYRRELLELLTQLVRDMDRKIERQKERAAKESDSRVPTPPERSQLEELKGKEKEAQRKSEEAAEGGNVDASMLFAQQAERFKKQHDDLHRQFTTPERSMSVCDICGVFINSTDNDQRKADHLAGKQYLGWLAIREKLAEVKQDDDERTAARGPGREQGREPGRERSAPGREHGSREHGHERSRDRTRERERPREDWRRSESRDHHRSSRSDRHRADNRDRRRSRSREGRGSEIPPPGNLYAGQGGRHGRERERQYHR